MQEVLRCINSVINNLNRETYLLPSHLGADPSWVNRCHQYVECLEVLSLTASQHVQCCLVTNSPQERKLNITLNK